MQYFFHKGAERTAADFLFRICSGQINFARELATGKAAWDLAQAQNLPVSQVKQIETSTAAGSRDWAEVNAKVTQKLQDGSWDTSWYKVYLAKKDGAWKVYKVAPAEVQLKGSGTAMLWTEIEPELEATLQSFLETLKKGNYSEARRFLTGQARTEMEKQESVMKGSVFQSAEIKELNILWHKDGSSVTRVEYSVDGRDVLAVITFSQTPEGWKIAEICNF